jgi:hypothetical protein
MNLNVIRTAAVNDPRAIEEMVLEIMSRLDNGQHVVVEMGNQRVLLRSPRECYEHYGMPEAIEQLSRQYDEITQSLKEDAASLVDSEEPGVAGAIVVRRMTLDGPWRGVYAFLDGEPLEYSMLETDDDLQAFVDRVISDLKSRGATRLLVDQFDEFAEGEGVD